MAVGYGTASSANATTATWSVTKPASLVSGEVLIAFVTTDTGTPNITGGSTWTSLASGAPSGAAVGYRLAWKVAGGSEPASYTASQTAGGAGHASIIRATDPATTTPVFAVNGTGQTDTVISTPSVTPGGPADLLIRFASGTGAGSAITWTAPAGHTERTDSQSGTGTSGTTATQILSSSAATGTANFTASLTAFGAVGITVAVASNSFPQTVTPSAIASSEAFGTAQLNFTIVGSGIASSEAFGSLVITTPQAQIIAPSGITSGQAFGTATLGLFIRPTGIASGEAFGTARLSAVIGPTGIASAEAFGLTALGIEQFITPTGIPSGQAFGTLRLQIGYPQTIIPVGIVSEEVVEDLSIRLRSQLVLTNPSIQETPAAWSPLFARFGLHRGITIIQDASGAWSSVRYPSQTEIEDARTTYMGGHRHTLTPAEAEELILAGYGSFITLEDIE